MRYLDEGLKIWMDILTNPAFPDDKLRRREGRGAAGIRNRNRNVTQVAARVVGTTDLRRGLADRAEDATEADDHGHHAATTWLAWHKKYWGANNAILVVSGDFKKAEMLQKLEATFGKWRTAEKAVPPIPRVQQAAQGRRLHGAARGAIRTRASSGSATSASMRTIPTTRPST